MVSAASAIDMVEGTSITSQRHHVDGPCIDVERDRVNDVAFGEDAPFAVAALDHERADVVSGHVPCEGLEVVGRARGLDVEGGDGGHRALGVDHVRVLGHLPTVGAGRWTRQGRRSRSGLESQFLETPSGLWGTGFAKLPQLPVGTLTVWKSGDAAADFTGGGFFGFRPLSTRGSVGGKNPVSAGIVPA